MKRTELFVSISDMNTKKYLCSPPLMLHSVHSILLMSSLINIFQPKMMMHIQDERIQNIRNSIYCTIHETLLQAGDRRFLWHNKCFNL